MENAVKPVRQEVFFQGFERKDGTVGVRNEIWIVPTVGCVNNVAGAIAAKAGAFVRGSVDEVIAFSHPYGCSQMGDDQEHTRTVLASQCGRRAGSGPWLREQQY